MKPPVNRYWGDKPLPTDKTEFFNAITLPAPTGDGNVATIRLYGPIDSYGGFWGVSAEDVSSVLDTLPASVSQIILRVNSPGGEVFEALAILNMLRAHKATVTAVVDGLAASAASLIAAAADELVMSPGTQLMIHSPLSFEYGNATELRKTAEVLDSIETSLIEIYSGKAGDKDWPALLAAETWLTAEAALELGLADRVGLVADAGDAVTAAEAEPELLLVEPASGAEVEDHAQTSQAALAYLRSRKPPIAAALGSNTERKETAVAFSTDQLKTMRSELSLAEDADEAAIMAAFVARTKQSNIPEGVEIIDATALTELRAQAALGVQAREQQVTERRERLVDNAISKGKFAAARRDHFLNLLKADEEGTTVLLDSLAENTIPIAEIGFGAGDTVKNLSDDDKTYEALYPTPTKKEA